MSLKIYLQPNVITEFQSLSQTSSTQSLTCSSNILHKSFFKLFFPLFLLYFSFTLSFLSDICDGFLTHQITVVLYSNSILHTVSRTRQELYFFPQSITSSKPLSLNKTKGHLHCCTCNLTDLFTFLLSIYPSIHHLPSINIPPCYVTKMKECREKKKVCPFLLLKSPRQLSAPLWTPWTSNQPT